MGAAVRPAQVRRRGIAGLTGLDARRAVRAGTRLRLVVRGVRQGGRVRVSVAPERIPFGDPLSGSGPDAALVLETDLMGEIGVFERGATVDQTAYALLSDLLEIVGAAAVGLAGLVAAAQRVEVEGLAADALAFPDASRVGVVGGVPAPLAQEAPERAQRRAHPRRHGEPSAHFVRT